MKRNIFIAMMTILVIFASSCERESNNKIEKSNNDQKSLNFTSDEIDSLSIMVANFHTYIIDKYLNEIYSNRDTLNQEYYDMINRFIQEEMKNKVIIDSIDENIFDYYRIRQIISITNNGYDFSVLDINNIEINYILISTKCKKIEDNTLILLQQSITFEDFRINYYAFINQELNQMLKNTTEYMCIRLFAETYLSSFECWAKYLYNDSKAGWWDNTKKYLKSAWENELKPMVKADAGGAVGGALVGAAVGGVGAGPGAITGACGASIIQGFTQL